MMSPNVIISPIHHKKNCVYSKAMENLFAISDLSTLYRLSIIYYKNDEKEIDLRKGAFDIEFVA